MDGGSRVHLMTENRQKANEVAQKSANSTQYFLYVFGFIFVIILITLQNVFFSDQSGDIPFQKNLDLFKPDLQTSVFERMEKNDQGEISLKLKEKIPITDDTYIFRFKYPEPEMSMGVPIGNNVRFLTDINGEEIKRKYTPISKIKDSAYVDYAIKIYRSDPNFPDGGLMT